MELPPWAAALPAPIRCAFYGFFFSMFTPDDGPQETLRKVLVGVLGIGSPFLLTFALHIVANPEHDEISTSHIVCGVAYGLYAIVMFLNFVLVKVNPQRATTAVSIALTAPIPLGVAVMISNLTLPGWANFGILAITAICADVPTITWPLAAVYALLFGAAAYNHVRLLPELDGQCAAADDHVGFLLALSNPIVERTLFYRAATMVAVFSNFCLAVLVVWLQRNLGKRVTAEADATARLADKLAESLSRYDTTEARAQLTDARESSVARPQVLDRLEKIVSNLEDYRPHLPNWLVDDCAVGEHTQQRSTAMGSDPGTASSNSKSLSASSLVELPQRSQQQVRNATVVVAHVGYRLADDWVFASEAAHRFVDRVHAVAAQTSGAVHCFVGDTVVMTWNAVRLVAQPEAKAAGFLARLRGESKSDGLLWGGAVAGPARVHLAGRGAQQAVVASFQDPDALQAVAAEGRRRKCFMVDERMYSGSRHGIEFVGGTVLWPTDGGAGPTRGLYAVVGEHQEADGEEWLYVVRQRGATSLPTVATCEAVQQLSRGATREAHEHLCLAGLADSIPEHDASREAILAAVVRAADRHLCTPAPVEPNMPFVVD